MGRESVSNRLRFTCNWEAHMRDRTTKALLVLVVLGLWANVASGWVRANPAREAVPFPEFLSRVERSGQSDSPLIAEQAFQGTVPAIPRETPREQRPAIRAGDPIGDVITGTDLGFQRVVSSGQQRADQVPGYLVVKVNGEWRRVTGTPGPMVVPAGTK